MLRLLTGPDLNDWFTTGAHSVYATTLQTGPLAPFNLVSAYDYIRLMTVVALAPQFGAGNGNPTAIRFNIMQTPLNLGRPPAIGLGHELIHAYWAARGEQLGYELFTPSTLLYEMKCVGLGPWAGAIISENQIRAQWGAALGAAQPQRMVYELAVPNNLAGRLLLRASARTI